MSSEKPLMFTSLYMHLACVQSYGENCGNSCSPHCYNQTCDRFNGQCLIGCKDGYYGEKCNEGNDLPKLDVQIIIL